MYRIVLILSFIIPLFFHGTVYSKGGNWNDLEKLASTEQRKRNTILKKAESLLLNSKYDKLDEIADKFRSSKEQYLDGEWKLSALYRGMSCSLRQVSEANCIKRLEKLKDWVASKPDSITAHVALAECMIGYAFHGRGGTFARDVTEGQWQLFNERIKDASDVIISAEKLSEDCPGWYAAYLGLGLSGNIDDDMYEQIFESAISYEPTYNLYYFRKAYHLLPRWHGAKGD